MFVSVRKDSARRQGTSRVGENSSKLEKKSNVENNIPMGHTLAPAIDSAHHWGTDFPLGNSLPV